MKFNQTKPSRMTRNNFQIVFSLFFALSPEKGSTRFCYENPGKTKQAWAQYTRVCTRFGDDTSTEDTETRDLEK